MSEGGIVLTVFYIAIFTIIVLCIVYAILCKKLNSEALSFLGLSHWEYLGIDKQVIVKSSKSVESYDALKFFKDNREMLDIAYNTLVDKNEYAKKLSNFLENNDFEKKVGYSRLAKKIKNNLKTTDSFYVNIFYRSPAGKSQRSKTIAISREYITDLKNNPAPIMSKSEYNKLVKEKNNELLTNKQKILYDMINSLIDTSNLYRDDLIIKEDQKELDRLISTLLERTINSIKKIKDVYSPEWDIIENLISSTDNEVETIIKRNQRILDYYDSDDFAKIKQTCNSLMETQKDFNEYINKKAQSISSLFGSKVVRNETENSDVYNYIRPYKKSITPFTAEVSSSVFANAENNPIEYIVKNFYSNKELYPEQIQKLQLLIEELETLKDAKQIIENYKKDYQQYLTNVPDYVMENDEDGFYTRLGFANISESILTVEYKFSYTSEGGMAQRSFTVPMTEETIISLINLLESKLTMAAFAKEQRSLMTSKLRQSIKERDNYTCKICGNSIFNEPNLLLEIDHIIPISKGGFTVADNLQTLCWKCNREKSNKLILEQ